MAEEFHWLVPSASVGPSGHEKFTGMPETSVLDFWQFALGDLRMNNARGYLAEFLVGKALGVKELKRIEWDSYDLLFDDITVEIKSSAYLQSWEQKKISALSFSGLQGTRSHPRAPGDGMDPEGRQLNAMVYVFCAHTATDHARYDQLNVFQWEFHVGPRCVLAATGQKSLGIAKVRQLSGGPTPWDELANRVKSAAADQHRDDDAPWWSS